MQLLRAKNWCQMRALGASALCFGVLLLPATVFAQTLTELWERVATTEPTLLAATAQARAVAERKKQTFAQFLPQVNLTANTTHNHREYQTTGAFPNFSNEWYNSHGAQLNVTQPLWKKANDVAHKQSKVATEQAIQQLQATQQDLLNKLIVAWAEALYARDALRAAHAIEAAAAQQMVSFERGFALGVYAINQRDEAKAKRQQAVADRYVAESEMFARHSSLEQLVGPLPAISAEYLNLEMQKIPFGSLRPLNTLIESLDDTNPGIRAAEKALQVAQEEVRKQTALHGPSLDLVAGVGRNNQAAGSTPGQSGFKTRLDTVALQFSMPLYTGGAQTSKVKEAVDLETKARYELDSAKRNATNQAQQAWAQLRSAQAKFEAAEQALIAGKSIERVAIVGIKNGTKTPADELQAKQLIETALRDARRAYYDNVIGHAKLMTATGLIEESTLEDIQKRLLVPTNFLRTPNMQFVDPNNDVGLNDQRREGINRQSNLASNGTNGLHLKLDSQLSKPVSEPLWADNKK
jgi:outer membrane protein